MFRKMSSIKNAVKYFLTKYHGTRDNDRLLMLKVWAGQNPRLRDRNYSFVDFATDFITGHYADPESIRRSRQKLQEQHPELRGGGYKLKKEELEPEMREAMRK